jgi:hypothetical protein
VHRRFRVGVSWVPACAGMTGGEAGATTAV